MTHAEESDGVTVISFSRQFQASDDDDMPLNSSYVLWAFGSEINFDPSNSSSISFHGGSSRGTLTNSLPSSSMLCEGKCLSNPGN